MRKIISIILGFVLILAAFFVVKIMIDSNQKKKIKAPKIIKTVFVETVQNKEIPVTISASGNLIAKNKIKGGFNTFSFTICVNGGHILCKYSYKNG